MKRHQTATDESDSDSIGGLRQCESVTLPVNLRDILCTYDILILVLRALLPWQLCEFAQVCRW